MFNRGTLGTPRPAEGDEGASGIAVYRLDFDTGTEQQIREVWDYMNLSPDGSRFLGAKPIPDGRIGTEIFDVDGSNHVLLPIPDPTLQLGAGSWSRDGKWIVTGGWDDTDPSRGGLYTFRSADGGGLVRLTHPASPPNDYPVAYSPDGSRILFIREKEPYDHSGPMNVFVVRRNGSGVVRLNPPGTSSLLEGQSWSPDGRQVAFVASRDGHDGSAVFVVNVDGTHARRITPWNVTLKAEWSPDGQWIAFDKAESEPVPRDLFVVHPDGTGLRQITSNEDNKMSFAPTWSSDSETLLFIRREYGVDGTDLWTVHVDGTGMFQVTHSPADYSGYRWIAPPAPTASNGEIVLVRGLLWRGDTNPELFSVDPETGAIRHVVTCDQECSPGTWSPDGTELLYSSGGRLYRLDAETGSSRVVVSGRGVSGDLSPDGERIVYEAGRPPKVPTSFFLIGRDGNRRKELGALAGLNILWYRWSPDGRSIAYWEHAVHFSDSSIRVLELDGSSRARTLVSFSREDLCNPYALGCTHSVAMDPVDGRIAYATFEPEQACDGTSSCAWTEEKAGTDRIHVIDPVDGSITVVATLPSTWLTGHLPSVMAWSPDGSRLAFAAGCQIWSIAPDSADRELLVDLGACAMTPDQLTWSPDGTELAFFEFDRTIELPDQGFGALGNATLTVLTVDGGAVRRLGTFERDDIVGLVPMAWRSIPIRQQP